MADESCILAASVDYHRIEAAIVDAAGGILHVETAPLRVAPRMSMHQYIDAGSLVDTFVRVVRAALERKPREARRIEGVGLIGRSLSIAPVTAAGPQAPFILPGDPRMAARRKREIPWDAVYEAVGLTSRRCEIPFAMAESVEGRDGVFCTPKDFVKWALTGRFSTDPLDAQRTFLWDLATREWSRDLARIFGADLDRLPDIMAPTAPAGRVTAGAASATGLKEGIIVSCGMGDWGEYLGTGAFDEGDAFEHIGATAALYGVTTGRPSLDRDLEVRPHVGDGRFLVGREDLPGGTCLEWLLKKTYLARAGEIDWGQVDEELEAVAAMGRPENVLFFPALSEDHGQIKSAAYLNLHIEDDLTSLIQATVEGVFFTLNAVAEELKSLAWTPTRVFTTGQVGFKHAPRRTRANIYGLPIHAGRVPGANVTSAALVGAVAAGLYPTLAQARSAMLNTDSGVRPVEQVQSLYEAHFASWLGTRGFLSPGGES